MTDKPPTTLPDSLTRVLGDSKASRVDLARVGEAVEALRQGIKARPSLRPAPAYVLPEPELEGAALRYAQMARLALLMRDRSPAAYQRAKSTALEELIAEIKTRAETVEGCEFELGGCLVALKERMPKGIKWKDYLKDAGVPLSKSRANELIQVFKGQVTVLQLQEKEAAKKRKARAKAGQHPGRAIVDSKEESAETDAANRFIRELLEFTKSFTDRLAERATAGFSQPDREALQHTLHQCANELHLAAQHLEEDP